MWPSLPAGAKKKGIGVVSDRAIKHLHELTELHQQGTDAAGRKLRSAVLFIVSRWARPVHLLLARGAVPRALP